MYPRDVRLLKCKNVWSKDNRELMHLLTYEVSYENGRIERIHLTVVSPFQLRGFQVSEEPRYSDYTNAVELVEYLHLSVPYANRVMVKNVKTIVVQEADPVEMTVEEIEAELGKKIKIVSKE